MFYSLVYIQCFFVFVRTNDIIDEIQQPCSEVLVRLCRSRPNGCGGMNGKSNGGGSYIERVMEAVMTKFQPGTTAHYYIITTLSAIAVVNPIGNSFNFLDRIFNQSNYYVATRKI